MIYLDNAATSFPKPAECLRQAVERYLEMGASPGRGGYDMAVEAEAAVSAVRRKLRRFFGAGDDHRVCFAHNATDALNSLLQGLLRPGDHVVSTRLEHNSVLRPLHHLRKEGRIRFDLVPFDSSGFIEPEKVAAALKPETRLVILTHASNVLGTVQPVAEIAAACRARGVPLVLDASQSAGVVPIRIDKWGVQGLAFTGHKSLLGPTGIGGLVLGPALDPEPTRFGGTGVDSRSPFHTLEYPFRLEAGTINLLGVLGLEASLDYVSRSSSASYSRELLLLKRLREGLRILPRVRLLCADRLDRRLPVLTCTVADRSSEDVSAILDGDFGIAVRAGLHCAPLVHQDLGTIEKGAVRFSLGPFTTDAEIDATIGAMRAIAGGT
ncbi:MAG: aminotransferase class V-fold PLP-dependent enzyme [Desulfobacteraceae bacterium]|nr:MAG: aminotransferase class V-fold PLP-dependent enzyme [Desulfobacteraceae bacterium]